MQLHTIINHHLLGTVSRHSRFIIIFPGPNQLKLPKPSCIYPCGPYTPVKDIYQQDIFVQLQANNQIEIMHALQNV